MSETYDLEDLLHQAYADEISRQPKQHSQRTPECPHPSFYARYARTGWPPELGAHAATCAYCQKSKAVWSETGERAPEHLDNPEEIRNAARLLARTAADFFETLIGYSSMPAAVPAAAGTLVLSAELNRYRGGTVVLDLGANGRGVLRARFNQPPRVLVSLYDTETATLLPFTTDNADKLTALSIQAGISKKDIWVDLPHQSLRALRIIVQKTEESS